MNVLPLPPILTFSSRNKSSARFARLHRCSSVVTRNGNVPWAYEGEENSSGLCLKMHLTALVICQSTLMQTPLASRYLKSHLRLSGNLGPLVPNLAPQFWQGSEGGFSLSHCWGLAAVLCSSETGTSVPADGPATPDDFLYIKTLFSFKPHSPTSESVVWGGGCGFIGVRCKKTPSKC